MKVEIIGEYGHAAALLGLGLSYGITSDSEIDDVVYDDELGDKMRDIATRMTLKGGSHAKFLESIAVWLDITAPRYWWQEFDTYRVGVTKQSESTMHTLKRRQLEDSDFENGVMINALSSVNRCIGDGNFTRAKKNLPEGFLQRRVVCLNYKALAHIQRQRRNHELEEWQMFIDELRNLFIPEYVFDYVCGER